MKDYKFDIIGKAPVDLMDDSLEFFLGKTKEEALKTYNEHKDRLNYIANSYASCSGLEKSDLFGVSLLALAKAKVEWDDSRSDDFEVFATFIIKDHLNEYVRKNRAQIVVPSYVKKANRNLTQIISICDKYHFNYIEFVIKGETPKDITSSDLQVLAKCTVNLKNAADRAKVKLQEFIKRIAFTPSDVNIDSAEHEAFYNDREKEILEAKLLITQLKKYMNEIELLICEKIMEDKSYEQIGQELGKSVGWVSNKMTSLRQKLVKIITRER